MNVAWPFVDGATKEAVRYDKNLVKDGDVDRKVLMKPLGGDLDVSGEERLTGFSVESKGTGPSGGFGDGRRAEEVMAQAGKCSGEAVHGLPELTLCASSNTITRSTGTPSSTRV